VLIFWQHRTIDYHIIRDTRSALNFDFRCCKVLFDEDSVAQLARACRLVFAIDGSSWLPCTAKPRCLPERLAAEIFRHHTKGANFDPEKSGAEWWAQVRQGGHAEEGVQFHWDTDEVAVERHNVNLHPHLSTVTYLTDCGAPTLIVDRRNPLKPELLKGSAYGTIHEGMLSYPQLGKHIVFDGQLLHGTVPRPGERGERVTFLVNVWLNHRPSNCRIIPDSLAAQLGDGALDISLGASERPPSHAVRSAGEEFKATFGRREQNHQLKVVLPQHRPTDSTVLLQWTNTAHLGAAEIAGQQSSSADA